MFMIARSNLWSDGGEIGALQVEKRVRNRVKRQMEKLSVNTIE